MRKWAWRIFVIVSAVLLVGAASMWARAQFAWDSVTVDWADGPPEAPRSRWCMVAAYRGAVAFNWGWASVVEFTEEEVGRIPEVPAPARATPPSFAKARAALPITRPRTAPAASFELQPSDASEARHGWTFGGLAWEHARVPPSASSVYATIVGGQMYSLSDLTRMRLAIPWWLLTLCFALAPARAAWTFRVRRRRRRPHECAACGYDLRATADAAGPRLATCPECGRPSAPM